MEIAHLLLGRHGEKFHAPREDSIALHNERLLKASYAGREDSIALHRKRLAAKSLHKNADGEEEDDIGANTLQISDNDGIEIGIEDEGRDDHVEQETEKHRTSQGREQPPQQQLTSEASGGEIAAASISHGSGTKKSHHNRPTSGILNFIISKFTSVRRHSDQAMRSSSSASRQSSANKTPRTRPEPLHRYCPPPPGVVIPSALARRSAPSSAVYDSCPDLETPAAENTAVVLDPGSGVAVARSRSLAVALA